MACGDGHGRGRCGRHDHGYIINNPGSGYIGATGLTFTQSGGGTPTTAAAAPTATVASGGTGYSSVNPPIVTITPNTSLNPST